MPEIWLEVLSLYAGSSLSGCQCPLRHHKECLFYFPGRSPKAPRWNLLKRGAINMFSSHPEVPLKTPAGILIPPASLIAIYVLIAEAKVTTWPRA